MRRTEFSQHLLTRVWLIRNRIMQYIKHVNARLSATLALVWQSFWVNSVKSFPSLCLNNVHFCRFFRPQYLISVVKNTIIWRTYDLQNAARVLRCCQTEFSRTLLIIVETHTKNVLIRIIFLTGLKVSSVTKNFFDKKFEFFRESISNVLDNFRRKHENHDETRVYLSLITLLKGRIQISFKM